MRCNFPYLVYDINSKIRFSNNIFYIIHGIKPPNQVLYETCCDYIIKCILFG